MLPAALYCTFLSRKAQHMNSTVRPANACSKQFYKTEAIWRCFYSALPLHTPHVSSQAPYISMVYCLWPESCAYWCSDTFNSPTPADSYGHHSSTIIVACRIDRLRGWLLIVQSALVFSISWMALQTPTDTFQLHIPFWRCDDTGLITAILSASHDSLINAWQTESIPAHERGLRSGLYVAGWSIGAILSGSLALVMAQYYGWKDPIYAWHFWQAVHVSDAAGRITTRKCLPSHDFQAKTDWSSRDFFREFSAKSMVQLVIGYWHKTGGSVGAGPEYNFFIAACRFFTGDRWSRQLKQSAWARHFRRTNCRALDARLSLYRALIILVWFRRQRIWDMSCLPLAGKNYTLLVMTAFLENFCSGYGKYCISVIPDGTLKR